MIVGSQPPLPNRPQYNSGDVANFAVEEELINGSQAAVCAGAFQKEHQLYLVPDPNGGRPTVQFPGMQFELPPECTTNLVNKVLPTPSPEIPTPIPSNNPNPPTYNPLNFWDCLGSMVMLFGLGGAGGLIINRRHRKKT